MRTKIKGSLCCCSHLDFFDMILLYTWASEGTISRLLGNINRDVKNERKTTLSYKQSRERGDNRLLVTFQPIILFYRRGNF